MKRLQRDNSLLEESFISASALSITAHITTRLHHCIAILPRISILFGRRLLTALHHRGMWRYYLSVLLIELLLIAQVAGDQKVKQTPQLGHIVLYRRAGKNQPVGGPDLFYGLEQLGFGALDQMALVQDAVVPLLPGEMAHVMANYVVGTD